MMEPFIKARDLYSLPARHRHIEAFAQGAGELCVPTLPPHLQLKKITAVGAFYNISADEGLCPRDGVWLQQTIAACREWDLPIAPQFSLTPLNLIFGQGQNFLNPAVHLPTDILISCLVINPWTVRGHYHANQYQGEAGGQIASEHLSNADAWREKAQHAGAKVIVAFSDAVMEGAGEVTAREFQGRHYKILATKHVTGPASSFASHTKETASFRMDVLISHPYATTLIAKEPRHKITQALLEPAGI